MSRQTGIMRLVLAAGWLLISSATSVQATTIYWTLDASPNAIQKSNENGTPVTTLLTDAVQELRYIAVDRSGGKIYFISALTPGTENKIKRANLDGSSLEDLVFIGSAVPNYLALDAAGGKIYWTQLAVIHRANLDGSGEEALLTLASNPKGLVVDPADGKMCWLLLDGTDTKIQRADLDGTNVADILTIVDEFPFSGLSIGSGKLYWGNLSSEIRQVNLDGTGLGTFTTLSSPIFSSRVDEQNAKLYWVLLETPMKIQRANLDGTGIEDHHVVAVGEAIIDLDITNIPPGPPIPTVSQWGLIVMVLLVLSAGTVIHSRRRCWG